MRPTIWVYSAEYGYMGVRRSIRHIVMYDLHTAYKPYMYLAKFGVGGPLRHTRILWPQRFDVGVCVRQGAPGKVFFLIKWGF